MAAAKTPPQHQGYEKVIPFTWGVYSSTLLPYITSVMGIRFKKEVNDRRCLCRSLPGPVFNYYTYSGRSFLPISIASIFNGMRP